MRKLAVCGMLLALAATISRSADIDGDWTAKEETSERWHPKLHFEQRGEVANVIWEPSRDERCRMFGQVGGYISIRGTCEGGEVLINGTHTDDQMRLRVWGGRSIGRREYTFERDE